MTRSITYYGHSCFLLELGGKNILFDPFITPNPLASKVDISTINPDYILISHGHGDHIADAVDIALRSEAQVIAAYEIVEWLMKKGVENAVPMNTGGTIDLGVCKVKLVNAAHSSSLPDGTYGGNPVGFVLESDGYTLYYAGDTALTLDMKLIGDEFDIDCAVLPIGDHFTMGVNDAIKAAKMVDCEEVIGMHYDTFPPITIDHAEAKQAFKARGITLNLLEIEQRKEL